MYSQQLKSGKYRFFESYIDPMTMTRKYVSVTMDKNTTQSRRAAQDALRVKIELLTSKSSGAEKVTLQGILDAYRTGVEGSIKEQTRIRNVRENTATVELLGGKTRAEKLTARYIVDKFASTDWSNTTKNERLKRFKAMMRWAYKMGYITSAEYLTALPHYEDNKALRRENKFLEPDELQALLDAMTVTLHKQITQFAALTGMRMGEIIALKNEDIDTEKRIIHVVATHSSITDEDNETKTNSSTRDIYIQAELLELINSIDRGRVYVFESDGKQVNYYTCLKYLKEVSLRAIGREITTHYLRHSHTAYLAQNKMELEAIAKRLGHHDSKVTREIYYHFTNQMKKEEHDLLDSIKIT